MKHEKFLLKLIFFYFHFKELYYQLPTILDQKYTYLKQFGKIADLPALEKDCCPNYLYSLIPNAYTQYKVEKFLLEFIYYSNIFPFSFIINLSKFL